jgi:hypothetical protein
MLPIGWKDTVIQMCKELKAEKLKVKILYMKEKYGNLSIEFLCDDEMNDKQKRKAREIIEKYEDKTMFICQYCNSLNAKERTIRDYVYNICNECYEKIKEDRGNRKFFSYVEILEKYGLRTTNA